MSASVRATDAMALSAMTLSIQRGIQRDDPAATFFNKTQRFDNHAFAAAFGVFRPPFDGPLLTIEVNEIDVAVLGGEKKARIHATK